jgi:5-methyltetrahydrofolate--homocysteine methyltransferase
MSFDTHGHTMMGVSPAKAVETLSELDVIGIGANCGTGPDELKKAVEAMKTAKPEAILMAKANAGVPQVAAGGEIVYDGTPEVMAQYARDMRSIGAAMIGGCCGNTPTHIRAMAAALGKSVPETQS